MRPKCWCSIWRPDARTCVKSFAVRVYCLVMSSADGSLRAATASQPVRARVPIQIGLTNFAPESNIASRLALSLRAIECDVGIAHHVVGDEVVERAGRDADARVHRHVRSAQPHRLRQHPLDPAGELDRFFVDAPEASPFTSGDEGAVRITAGRAGARVLRAQFLNHFDDE